MPDQAQTCDKCDNQTVVHHTISIDSIRWNGKICCLCAAEVIASMRKGADEHA